MPYPKGTRTHYSPAYAGISARTCKQVFEVNVTALASAVLLARMQRELGAGLEPDGFAHYAYYNAALGRIEMHLVSRKKQCINLEDEVFHFDEGETIHTENSYKYTAHEFQLLAREAGWHPKMLWSDRDGLFNVHYLSLTANEPQHLPQYCSDRSSKHSV